jgi:hypothetical protein
MIAKTGFTRGNQSQRRARQPSVHVPDQESRTAPSVPRDLLSLIDESTIERVVHRDSVLGEIFGTRIADWGLR